jgi:hypothetical protein
MIMRVGALFGVLMLMFLQACESPAPDLVVVDKPNDNAAASQPPPGKTPPVIAAVPRVAPSKPSFSETERDPRRLLRMSFQSVTTLLGKPQFVRREARARVWQYRTGACVLDLFLYDVTSEYEVVYYEFRPSARISGHTGGCFEKFLTRAAGIAKS